jgi:hypothetical protein
MKDWPKLLPVAILVLVLTGSCLLYLASLTPDRFGFFHDDGVYAIMAKALASGQGYRIISLPDEPPQTKYPPFYPFLLSLIWRVYPNFPDNLPPLMILSLLATLAFIALTWGYLTKLRYLSEWTALVVVALVASNWRTAILATNLYSEMTYALLSVAALWLADAYEHRRNSWAVEVILGMVIGLAFLTRTSGITLLVSVALYYLIRRLYGKAVVCLSVGCLFVLAWFGWSLVNRTTTNSVVAPFYTSYLADFAERVGNPMDLLSVVATNSFMLVVVSIPLVSLGLSYVQAQSYLVSSLVVITVTFLLFTIGFVRQMAAGPRLLHVYLICYLFFHLFWPYSTYDRFLIPLLPFLLVFLIQEFQVLLGRVRDNLVPGVSLSQKVSAVFFGLVLLGVGAVAAYNYVSGLYTSFSSKGAYAKRKLEDTEAIRWIKEHTAPSDVLLGYRDPVYYLYTGRKAIRSFWIKERFSIQGQDFGIEKVVFRIIRESNGQYLLATSSDFELESQPLRVRKEFKDFLSRYPKIFVSVFNCGTDCAIYRVRTDSLNSG